MLLTFFLLFFAFSLFCLVYGWYTSSDLWRIVGLLLLFLIGISLESNIQTFNPLGNLEYQNGTTEIKTIVTVGNTTTETNNTFPTYQTFSNHTIAFYTMITAILGLVLVMVERRRIRSS